MAFLRINMEINRITRVELRVGYHGVPESVENIVYGRDLGKKNIQDMMYHAYHAGPGNGWYLQSLGEAMYLRVLLDENPELEEDEEFSVARKPQLTRDCAVYYKWGDDDDSFYKVAFPNLRNAENPLWKIRSGYAFGGSSEHGPFVCSRGINDAVYHSKTKGYTLHAPDGLVSLSNEHPIHETEDGREWVNRSEFSRDFVVHNLLGWNIPKVWSLNEEKHDRLTTKLSFLPHRVLDELIGEGENQGKYVVCPVVLGGGNQKQRILFDTDFKVKGHGRPVKDPSRKYRRGR